MSNPTQATEAPQRIELPGGYYLNLSQGQKGPYLLLTKNHTMVGSGSVECWLSHSEAQAFAAAMTPAPVPAADVEALARDIWKTIENARDGHKQSAMLDVLTAFLAKREGR